MFERVPRVLKRPSIEEELNGNGKKPDVNSGDDEMKNDTSMNSKHLLCGAHLTKLIEVIEKLGDRASMKGILDGKP